MLIKWFNTAFKKIGKGAKSVVKRFKLWKKVDSMGGQLRDGTWTIHTIYRDAIFKSFFWLKSNKRFSHDDSRTDALERLKKLRSQSPLNFLLWTWKHNKDITGELYKHFIDDEKNHSFRLIAYYNAGYSQALSNGALNEEDERHLKWFEKHTDSTMIHWTFINSHDDFSDAFIEKMKIHGFHVYQWEKESVHHYYRIEFRKGGVI